jgi:hypothetical protein
VTSRVDAFMKARGLEGMNTGAITKPIDFVIRNSPWIVPAAVGAYGLNKMYGGSKEGAAAITEDELSRLAAERDAKLEQLQGALGGFAPPAQVNTPPQPPPAPPMPRGRSL